MTSLTAADVPAKPYGRAPARRVLFAKDAARGGRDARGGDAARRPHGTHAGTVAGRGGDYVALYRFLPGADPEPVAGPSREASGPVGRYGVAVGVGGTGLVASSLTIVDTWSGASAPDDYVAVSLDRAVVAAILPHARRLHGTLLAPRLSALLGEALLTLAQGAGPAAGSALAALLAGAREGAPCRRMAGEALASRRFRAHLFIEAQIARTDLDVSAIARGLGMSRSSLYRTFEAVGGVEREIVRRRIARLRSAVSHPGEARSIATLASDLGFASASHASRVFSAAYGMAPGHFRSVRGTGGDLPDAARRHGGLGQTL